ncbi:MAG: ABC transporter permease, partial [Elusimicrobia bacterium]|nr:ABC transporter permease [Elusimicrobiota bacterium]
LIAHPLRLLNTPFSVVLGLAYFYIPFMVLPLYGSLEKLPRQYLEASYDLGAGRARTFFKVTLPLCLPGVVAGCILTFIPCMGDFLTAEFLGGPRTYLVGNLIQNQFLMAQDWPFGAALTSVLLILLVAGLYFYQRVEPQR